MSRRPVDDSQSKNRGIIPQKLRHFFASFPDTSFEFPTLPDWLLRKVNFQFIFFYYTSNLYFILHLVHGEYMRASQISSTPASTEHNGGYSETQQNRTVIQCTVYSAAEIEHQ